MGVPPITNPEPTAQEKLAALQNTGSNQGTISAIEWSGHAVSAGYVAEGAIAAYGAGTLRCFAGRVALPLAGAMAGAYIANAVGADEGVLKVAELFGARRQAERGPQPAHVEHQIAHNHAFGGVLTGLLVGLAVGVGVALMIGTGGLLAPLVIGAAAGFAGAAFSGAGAKMADITGNILPVSGSPNVYFEDKRVARVTDVVACTRHSGPRPIIEGSKTIFVNDLPLSRIGHKVKCNAVIQQGCKTIFADNTTQSYGEPDAEFSVGEQLLLSAVEVIGFRSATREGGLLDGMLRKLFGEPIDLATGDYADYRTDFEYTSVLPLRLTRCYVGKPQVEGILGRKWMCNWSQRLLYAMDRRSVLLEDADGQRLVFALGGGPFDSIHLKAPYYHLTGTWQEARLFDSRSQQTLVFLARESNPYIGRLSAIEDRNGNRIDFVYFRNRLQRILHSDGVAFEVATTSEGYLRSVAVAGEDKMVVRYGYDERGGLTAVDSLFKGQFHYAYNDQGWLTHWQDSGATKVYFDYDEQGRVTGTRTPEGIYNDRFTYHPTERRTQYIDGTGARRELWFNADHLVIREQDPLGNVTQHTWDSLERMQSTTDAASRTTSYQYDDFGKLTAEIDWAGRTLRYQYDKDGLLTELQRPDGLKSNWEYDARGNLLKATRPDGCVTSYTYDDHGRPLSETNATGATRKWEYTAQGRVSARVDAAGQRTEIEQDVWGRPLSVKDAAGFLTRYEYRAGPENPRAALSRILSPDGGEERFKYDQEGLLAHHTAGEGQVTRFAYGAFDLLRSVTDAAGSSLGLDYDRAARLTQVTNAMGDRWIYSYDSAGRLAAETDWAGRRTRYVRDALGRLQSKVLPDGVEQHFLWDSRDRIVGVATAKARIEYEYDNADRLTRATAYYLSEKEIASETPSVPVSEVLLAYNERGQLKQEIQNGMPISYHYDEAGRCVSVISPSGATRLDFDPRGLLAGLDSNGHALAFERDALGLEVQRKYEPQTPSTQTAFTLQQSYDPCGRLAGQWAGRNRLDRSGQSSSFAPSELSRRYEWDKSGRLRGVQDSLRGRIDYHYDSRNQVLEVLRQQGHNTAAAHETYQYDALMNLARSNGSVHQYHHGQVEKIGNSTYHYDGRGRVVSKTAIRHGFRPQTWNYAWDDFDRLIEVSAERGQRWRYTYDAFGRRIKKQCLTPVNAGAVTSVSYLWQGAKVSEEWRTDADEGNSVEIDRWHYKPATFDPVAKETLTRTERDPFGLAKGKLYPVVTDQAGTPQELFDTQGDCVWQAEYSLWGRASVRSSRSEPSDTDCNLRFQGQWEDQESGLHYNLNRYYDPEVGQYLSSDPIALEGGVRSYGYVHNPLSWIDPTGLASCGHQAEFELRNSKGQIKTRGTVESGDTGSSRPTWREQLESHTERKIINKVGDAAEPGDILTIRGSKPPCTPGCRPAMREFAQEKEVKVMYSKGDDTWTFNPDGTQANPDGSVRMPNGRVIPPPD